MNKLIAIFYFLLSLYGCDIAGSTQVNRTVVNGGGILHSEEVAQQGVPACSAWSARVDSATTRGGTAIAQALPGRPPDPHPDRAARASSVAHPALARFSPSRPVAVARSREPTISAGA